MSLITNFVNILVSDIWRTLITIFIGFIVYKLSKFYLRVYSLPPGPIPLPIIGNVLVFRGTKVHWSYTLATLAEKYGPVFTIWLGFSPIVLISDLEVGREAFRKNEFAGRKQTDPFIKLFSSEKCGDVIFSDYGHRWEALRRVAHSAVLKYSTTDKLVYLISDCVDQTVKTIVDKEGLNKPFDPKDYIHNTFLNILAASAFGKRYDLEDPEYKQIRYLGGGIQKEFQNKFLIWSILPIMTKIDHKNFNKMISTFGNGIDLIVNKFKSHYKDYNESIVRDFSDTLITAKNDALREGKESVPYLTDENLGLVIMDIFLAGTDTSQLTFNWILFFMTFYPEVQQKVREEIENEIGDRIPTQEDRERCHYVQAVISETLRLRNIVPLGVNHNTVVDSKIGEYNIPKNTEVAVMQGHILTSDKYWPNAKEFKPERFLVNGKYVTTRDKAFIPFGIGRRVCLGEKLAIIDLILVVIRFIQATSDYNLVLHTKADTEPDSSKLLTFIPQPFTISLETK